MQAVVFVDFSAFGSAYIFDDIQLQNSYPVNCGDILVDDFVQNIRAPLPGETFVRDINLLSGDYGKSDGASLSYTIDTTNRWVRIIPGETENYWFAKFDAPACYNLTGIYAMAFDLRSPVGSTFEMTLTQHAPDCVTRTEDSVYLPITRYVVPNGGWQRVIVPFVDFGINLAGTAFDFAHLKDWTGVRFAPLNAVFDITNIRLLKQCTGNGTMACPAGGPTPPPPPPPPSCTTVSIDTFTDATRYASNLNLLGFWTDDGGMLADTVIGGRLRLTAPASGSSWWFTNLSPNTGVPSSCFSATATPILTFTYSGPAGGSFSTEIQIHGPACDSVIARRVYVPLTTTGAASQSASIDLRTLGISATELTRIKAIALVGFANGSGSYFIDDLAMSSDGCASGGATLRRRSVRDEL
ncbi:hypothetical protein BKA69DRAFT_1091121 [Paraphysoderma sedebokerense]|nr:hypothetical protein BKA69DRAFT_1091121 [Paraphysoderma sedebokerense]